MLDLSEKHRKKLTDIFSIYIPHMAVLAYGSRVTGGGHEGSDLDLVVINPKNPDLPQTQLFKL